MDYLERKITINYAFSANLRYLNKSELQLMMAIIL